VLAPSAEPIASIAPTTLRSTDSLSALGSMLAKPPEPPAVPIPANAGNSKDETDADRDLVGRILQIVNAEHTCAGNAGKKDSPSLSDDSLDWSEVEAIADTGLRIEVNRRELKNGRIQLYWIWRRRGKGREFYAHGGTAETLADQFPERLARYRPRTIARRASNLSANAQKFAGVV
jgi:hypothetical protein